MPAFEKISTLLGMYSFLNRAQNYAPIRPLGGKTPVEKVSALISNGNIPIGKMMAQPIIANNMDKIMTTVAKGFINNGNMNEMLSSMAKQLKNNNAPGSNEEPGSNSNVDFNSLFETFMPLINNMMSDSSSQSSASHDSEKANNVNNENTKKSEFTSHKENDLKDEYNNMSFNENTINNKEESDHKNKESAEVFRKAVPKNTPVNIRHRKRKNT